MTTTLGTTADTNDLYLDQAGNLALLTGQAAVEAACATAAKAQLGEMCLQTQAGIPNFETVFVGVPNLPIFRSYLRKTLLGVDGVNDVTALTVNVVQVLNETTGLNESVLTYEATIESIYGEEFTLHG